jgi:hypothetical protein
VSARFDWSPWLESDEQLLWEAKPNMLPIWVLSVSATTVMLGLMLGMHDGSAKARMGLAIAPWVVGIFALVFLAAPFVRNHYAATNRRLLTVHSAPWRKPKFSCIAREAADLQVAPRRPLIARDRQTGKQALSMVLSRKDEAALLSLVKRENT